MADDGLSGEEMSLAEKPFCLAVPLSVFGAMAVAMRRAYFVGSWFLASGVLLCLANDIRLHTHGQPYQWALTIRSSRPRIVATCNSASKLIAVIGPPLRQFHRHRCPRNP